MQQTGNYGLNQWELTDRIRMEDFNGDNAKIDAALKAQADALAEETAARAVLSAEAAKHGNCQVVFGTYKGTDTKAVSLSFPHKPVLVAVSGPQSAYSLRPLFLVRNSPKSTVIDATSHPVSISWGENSVDWSCDTAYYAHDENGRLYYYAALLMVE